MSTHLAMQTTAYNISLLVLVRFFLHFDYCIPNIDPVCLCWIHVDTEVLLQHLICPLCLAIGLKMECTWQVPFDSKVGEDKVAELQTKLGSTVGGNIFWKPMKMHNVGNKKSCWSSYINGLYTRDEVGYFWEMINDDHDRVKTLNGQEISDEIHSNWKPKARHGQKRL